MSPASDYVPVPVEAAARIATDYAKSIVIIWAWDPVAGVIHTTTYGTGAKEKQWAAVGGELGTKALGGALELAAHFQDYRLDLIRKLVAALRDIANWHDLPGAVEEAAENAIAEAKKWVEL